MKIKGLKNFNLDRKQNRVATTTIFTKIIEKLNSIAIGLSSRGMAQLLMVNPKTISSWEGYGLIFPSRKTGRRKRFYSLKDVLRGLTIKYLMSELGFRKYAGVKLVLELTNRSLRHLKQERSTIDNIYIDKYLIKVLNYNVEAITKMKLHGNSKVKRDEDNDLNNEDS